MTFRRWKRLQVVAGRRYRTAAGIIEVEAVEPVDPAGITDREAERSGFADAAAAVANLRGDPELPVYRIVFHRVDETDPRAELAQRSDLTDDEVAEIDGRLDRLDRASKAGPWTAAVLAVVGKHPARRAGDLATMLGREREPFKLDVRKLKNLGMTESLEVGYRLSPRGEAYLRRTQRSR